MWKRTAAICILGTAALIWAGTHAGDWLIVQDDLKRADAIVVFGGGMPFRAFEAARLYREGWAPQIWLPMPEGAAEWEAVKKLGLDPHDPDLAREVLVRLGVSREHIRILRPWVKNTRDEVEAALEELRRQSGRRCILVTSRQHTRRVSRLWALLSRNGQGGIVRYTEYQNRFQPARWWEREEDRRLVIHEWMGLAAILLPAWAIP